MCLLIKETNGNESPLYSIVATNSFDHVLADWLIFYRECESLVGAVMAIMHMWLKKQDNMEWNT